MSIIEFMSPNYAAAFPPAHTAALDRASLLLAVNQASAMLLKAPQFSDAIEPALAIVAQAMRLDRLSVGKFGGTDQPRLSTHLEWMHEWVAPGQTYQPTHPDLRWIDISTYDKVFFDAFFEERTPIYFDLSQLSEKDRLRQIDVGMKASFAIPIVVDDTVWGSLSGDDCQEDRIWSEADTEALQMMVAVIGAALSREFLAQKKLKAERERADEKQRLADLLSGIVQGSRILLESSDFEASLLQWLGRIGTATQASRAAFYDIIIHEPSGLRTGRGLCEWVSQDATGNHPVSFANPRVLDPRESEQAMAIFLSGAVNAVHTDECSGAMLAHMQAQGNQSVVAVPLMIDGAQWGVIGLDFAVRKTLDSVTTHILQTAADSLSAVIARNQAQEHAVQIQRERAEENARLADQLARIVQNARLILQAKDFEAGVVNWLGEFAQTAGAIRATLYDLALHEPSGLPTARVLCEWVSERAVGNTAVSFANPYTIDPRGAEDTMRNMLNGELAVFHTEDASGAMRNQLEGQGNETVIAVPLFIGDSQWGVLSIDYDVKQELGSVNSVLLQTAADSLAAVIARNLAHEQILKAQRERADELQKLAAQLTRIVHSSRQLLQAPEFENGVLQWLGEFAQDTRAIRATLYDLALHEPSGLPSARMLCQWVREGISGSVGMSLTNLHIVDPSGAEQMMDDMLKGNFSTFYANEALDPMRSFLTEQGNTSVVTVPLFVGAKQWGCLSLDFDNKEEPSQVNIALMQTAADTLGSIIKNHESNLARLKAERQRAQAVQAQEVAVLQERSRLAREIHDSIAQNFLAIQMQLHSLQEIRPPAAQQIVGEARSLARLGLQEARRAVSALRPYALESRNLPDGLDALLTQATLGTGIVKQMDQPAIWHALAPELEDHVYRMTQEALNNCIKHAKPSNIRIELSQSHRELNVLIADDGIGFDVAATESGGGFGLEGMRQRARLIGASIQLHSQPKKGTQLLITLPLEFEKQEEPRA